MYSNEYISNFSQSFVVVVVAAVVLCKPCFLVKKI